MIYEREVTGCSGVQCVKSQQISSQRCPNGRDGTHLLVRCPDWRLPAGFLVLIHHAHEDGRRHGFVKRQQCHDRRQQRWDIRAVCMW